MLNKPSSCAGCPMEFKGEGYAPPRGPEKAKLLMVGEALGSEEARLGKPFVGSSGRVLDSLLKAAGIVKEWVRFDNTMRCRPPGNRIPKDFDPRICAERHLFKEIKANRPNCIVMLGATPLKAVAGLEPITKQRGSVVMTKHGKAMATLHPAFLMRQQTLWVVVVADLKRAKDQSFVPDMPVLPDKFHIFPTYADVAVWCSKTHKEFSVDIETTTEGFHSCALICISFFNGEETMCIPWLKHGGEEYWPRHQQLEIVHFIHRLLAGPEPKCFQNGMFDVVVMEAFGFKVENWVFDTMLAHHLLYAEMRHGLDFIASVHTYVAYYKDEVKADLAFLALPDKVLRTYNCKDSMATGIAWHDLAGNLERRNLTTFFNEVTMALPPILMDMQREGMLVDTGVLAEAVVSYNEKSRELRSQLADIGVTNPTSLNYLKTLFFDTYCLPIMKKTKKGSASLDEDTLNKLSVKCYDRTKTAPDGVVKRTALLASKTIELVLKLRKNEKNLSTYLRKLPIAPDGKVHCSWLEHGTKTGRLSSREPNMQNVPPGIARLIYVAYPGHILVSFDYSQIELRIIAYEANDEALIEAYNMNRDIHSETAALLFFAKDVVLQEQPDWISDAQRQFAKSFVYCLNYGGEIWAVMAAHPGMITSDQGKRAQSLYYLKHPGIAAFRQYIKEELATSRMLYTSFGRPRAFFGSPSDILKSGYNFPIQGGAADVINKAMIRLGKRSMTKGLSLQVHDQLIFNLPIDDSLNSKIEAIKEEMSRPVTIKGRQVLLPVDVKAGHSWGNLTKWT